MPPLARVEIWTDLAAAAGTRKAFIADVTALSETRQLDGADTLTLRMRRESDAWAEIKEQRVLRVTYSDDTFDEWRMTGLDEERGKDGMIGVLTCASPLLDLARGQIERTEADGLVSSEFELLGLTPSTLMSSIILPAAPAYFALGTVDPTATLDLAFARDTPLSALRELATLTSSELRVRRNGTTTYLVDLLTQIGSTAAVVQLRTAKNITAIKRTTRSERQATRIYGSGGGEEGSRLTIAGARWKITAIAGLDVTLADPAGGDGPLAFDDQLNGLYLREDGAGSSTLISDSVVATQKVIVASVAGLAVNDIIRIERNATGDDLTYLEDPASKLSYGLVVGVLERQDIPPVRNLVTNPQLNGTYAGGLPSGWTKVGTPTTAEETATLFTRYGSKSCKVTATADGQGIETTAITILPTAAKPYFSWFVPFQIASGRVRVELVDLTNTKTYPDGTTGKAWSDQQKVWIETGMEAGLDAQAVSSTSVKLRIVADGGAATFYVDGAQLTQGAEQEPFYAGTGAGALWQAVNDELLLRGVPEVTIDVDLLDLQRFDKDVFPYDELVLGGTVKVTDADLWATALSTRIVEIGRDLMAEMETRLKLSNRPEDLTDVLVRPARRRRHPIDADTDIRPTVQATLDPLPGMPGQIQVQLAAQPPGAAIKYLVQNAGGTIPPVESSASWLTYGADFIVSQLESADRELAAYAILGRHIGEVQRWRIGQDTTPSVLTLTLSEPVSGTLRAAWAVDDDVARVQLYRKKYAGGLPSGAGQGLPILGIGTAYSVTSITRSGGIATVTTAAAHGRATGDMVLIAGATQTDYNGTWVITVTGATTFTYALLGVPTTPATGTITWKRTVMDEAQLVGQIAVSLDGIAANRLGQPLAGMQYGTGVGGTQWEETGYVNTDEAVVVVIPIDRADNTGPRKPATLTMAGAVAPALTSFTTAWSGDGASCASRGTVLVSWAVNGSVSDVTHDLEIWRESNGEPPALVKTEVSPVSTLSYTDTVEDFVASPGPNYTWRYTYKLKAGSTVKDSGTASPDITKKVSGTCPL